RNAIYTKLHRFYTQYDPKKLEDYETMSGLITYVETFGHELLNNTLSKKYGGGIDKPEPSVARFQLIQDQMAVRNEVYAKLYLFYQKHDPSRIPELEVAVEVIMNVGIDEFNNRCRSKYGETLDSQLEELREDIAEVRKERIASKRSEKKVFKPTNYAEVKEAAKKGQLLSLDIEIEQIVLKLVKFYQKHDSSSLSELLKITDFVIENGLATFDVMLREKYKDSLSKYVDEEYKNK